MSLFMAAMRQQLRETGQINGFGALSSAAWSMAVREHEAKLVLSSDPSALPAERSDAALSAPDDPNPNLPGAPS